jgi:TM2 domain-containing membrane protein YozV
MLEDKVWYVDDPDDPPPVRKKSAAPKPAPQKNPAAAFSWSLVIWGAGQLYNRQGAIGFLLLLLMVNCLLTPALLWVYWDALQVLHIPISLTASQCMLMSGSMYLAGLIVWFVGAVQAYHRTDTARTTPFHGIANRFFPAICSLLIPGWGQFLNGQAKKGTLFLVIALIAFFAVPVLLMILWGWPMLHTAADRLFWEAVLIAVAALAPLALLIWPVAGFDAFVVSRDDTKKAPVLKRLEYANNRRRMYGLGRGVFPYFEQTLMLGLLLVFFATVTYYYVPRGYYIARLQTLRDASSEQHMVLIPRLLDHVVHDVIEKRPVSLRRGRRSRQDAIPTRRKRLIA